MRCAHVNSIRAVTPSSWGCQDGLASGRSYEPGEGWFWCYVDEVVFELATAPAAAVHR